MGSLTEKCSGWSFCPPQQAAELFENLETALDILRDRVGWFDVGVPKPILNRKPE